MNLIQMSAAGALMIACILLIRLLGLNRLPKRIFLALWAAALLRLLFPIVFPSPFPGGSLFTSVTKIFTSSLPSMKSPAAVPPDPSGDAVPPFFTAPSAGMLAGQAQGWAGQVPQGWASYPWKTLALLIWVVGFIAAGSYFCIAYFRIRWGLMLSTTVENDFLKQFLSQQHLKRTVTVRLSDAIPAPLTYGLLHPVILMPDWTDWSDTQPLRYILTHECIHIRRFDGIAKLLLTVCVCLHWFNPLVWAMYIMANRDLELACDEAVVRRLGPAQRSAYARTLVGMEAQKSGLAPFCSSFRGSAVEQRIRAIMAYQKASLWTAAAGTLAVAALLTAFTIPAPPTQEPPDPSAVQTGIRAASEKPGVRIFITSAAVQILPARDHEFSAAYDSEVFDVSIGNEDGLTSIEISGRAGNHMGAEPVKLYWPQTDYGDIRIHAQYASLECGALRSGNITATFDSSSVTCTLPQAFSGMFSANATDSFFHLLVQDRFRNSKVTVADADGSCSVPSYFQRDSVSSAYTYADGTQENEIQIAASGGYTMIGDGVASSVINRFKSAMDSFMDGLDTAF